MPYIKQSERTHVDNTLMQLGEDWCPKNAGELNYFINKAVDNYLGTNGINYANINEMIGALECAKLEIYRMHAAPYEDKKLKENGPIF